MPNIRHSYTRPALTSGWGGSLLFLLILLCAIPSWGQEKEKRQKALDLVTEQLNKKNADCGVYIGKVTDSEPLFSFQENKAFCPASVTKLVTTASALRLLGPDFSFKTEVAIRGKVKNHCLYGDLLIRGSGDPTLFSEKYPEDMYRLPQLVLQALEARGIEKIDGAIVVDAARWGNEGFNAMWEKEDYGTYYAPGVYAVNCFDNKIEVRLNSEAEGTTAVVVSTYPEETGVRFISRIQTEKRGGGMNAFGKVLDNERILTGKLSPNRQGVRLRTDLPSPAEYVASFLKRNLQSMGIDTQNTSVMAYYQPYEALVPETLLAEYYSPNLTSMVHKTNVYSINLYAESLLRALANSSSKELLSWKDALQVEHDLWYAHNGITLQSCSLFDGSGLSRSNRLSPETLALILKIMTHESPEVFDSYRASLPRVGHEGTVKHILPKNDKQIYLKSGSMRGIRCYAGYAEYQGERYVVVFMANQVKKTDEAIRTFASLLSLFFE